MGKRKGKKGDYTDSPEGGGNAPKIFYHERKKKEKGKISFRGG